MEHPRAVFEAGGLQAATRFFDFFPAHVQRLALGGVCLAVCEGAAGQRREDAARLLPAVPFLIKCLGLEDEQVRCCVID